MNGRLFTRILLAGALWDAVALCPRVYAEIRQPILEALVRRPRIEIMGTRETQGSDYTSAGALSDSSDVQRSQGDGFVGLGLGPLFVGASQHTGATERLSLVSRDRTNTYSSDALSSWLVNGLFTKDRDNLTFVYTGGFAENIRKFNNTVTFDTTYRFNQHRGGIFYRIFGLGVGVIHGAVEQELRHQELGVPVVDETYRYPSNEVITSLSIGDGKGFFLYSYFVDGRAEGVKGVLFNLAPGKSVYQLVEVGYGFASSAVISVSYAESSESSEVTNLTLNTSKQQETALNFRVGSISIGISDKTVTSLDQTRLNGGGLEVTKSTYKLSQISLGYHF